MPIYEFECDECCCRFEKLMLPSENGNPPCPKCNAAKTRKVMSVCSNVTLKVPAGYGGGAKGHSCAPSG